MIANVWVDDTMPIEKVIKSLHSLGCTSQRIDLLPESSPFFAVIVPSNVSLSSLSSLPGIELVRRADMQDPDLYTWYDKEAPNGR